MARKPDEREFEDDIWEDEDEFSDAEEFEQEDSDNESDEFDYNKLSSKEKKRFDKMKDQIESAVVEAIASGDPNSGAYKGLQRVLAKRDRELAETRAALAQVIARIDTVESKGTDVDFVQNILKDMLDEDGKKEFDNRFERHKASKKQSENEKLLQALLQAAQGQNQFSQVPMYGQQEEDPQIRQYRKEATTKLKNFAKKMGVDPESKGLDFGDEDEPLLARMDKLASSIERLQDEQDDEKIDRVRRKTPVTPTRTRNEPATRDTERVGPSLLERGTAQMIERMRKLNA